MIYKFEYNKYMFDLRKTMINILRFILSIISSFCVSSCLIIFYLKYFKFFDISPKVFFVELFIVFIILNLISIVGILKLSKPFFYTNMSDVTYGFLGIFKEYTECFVKVDENNNEFFTVFNANIENRIYYDEIKKIHSFRKILIIKYNKKSRIILPNINELKETIKEKI